MSTGSVTADRSTRQPIVFPRPPGGRPYIIACCRVLYNFLADPASRQVPALVIGPLWDLDAGTGHVEPR
ncbi:MAG TPA: hypothetical protein VKY74_22380 [Chloroflexia bacterium]|nr:hypothetical protein [Chloroflexia bacterium]